MKRIQFRIDPSVLARWPDARVVGLAVSSCPPRPETLDVRDDEQVALTESYNRAGITLQNLPDDERIAPWRDAARESGLKASTYRSSAEQLARRVLQRTGISAPLPLVRRYCFRSAQYLAPLGGYNASALPFDQVVLRHALPGSDTFHPLGGKSSDFPITARVVVYASGSTVICWAFNHRDAFDTRLTEQTRRAVFFSEALVPHQLAASMAALNDLRSDLLAAGASAGGIQVSDGAVDSILELEP